MLDYFLQRSIKSELNNNNRKHTFLNFEGMHNILVLFDIQDWEMVSPIIEDLKKHGKNVMPWTVKPKLAQGQAHQVTLPQYVRVVDTHKDLDWKRLIRSTILSEFDNLKYDTFLDLSLEPNDYTKLLLVRNRSNFCLGFTKKEEKLYDFIILKEDNQSLFDAYEQLKLYLAHIKQV